MSLIQEALKRQQEEENHPAGDATETIQSAVPTTAPPPEPTPAASLAPPPLAPPPVVPPHKPRAPAAAPPAVLAPIEPTEPLTVNDEGKEKKKKGHPARTLFLVLVIVFLVLAGGGWMIMFAVQRWLSSEIDDADLVAVTEVIAVNIEPTGQIPTAQPEPDVAPPVPVAPVEEEKPSMLATLKQVATPSSRDGRDASPRRSKVKWPDLSLTGVVGKGVSGSAMLNGQLLSVGESTDGVTLIGIGSHGVELSCKGDRKTLKVGGSIE
jgi:hypothetical protein